MVQENFGESLKALVVDSSQTSTTVITNLLKKLGFQVASCSTIAQAIARWSEAPCDLLFADLALSDGSGLSFVQWVLAAEHDCSIVMTTSDATISSLIEALRLNVSDYVLKPYDNTAALTERLRRICENLTLKRRERLLMADLQQKNERLKQLTAQLLDKNRQLEALATKDILTGLNNHDYFIKRLTEEVVRSGQNGSELALILLDVDNFQQFNVLQGYPAGNELLRLIASGLSSTELLDKATIPSVVASRMAGDDFAILLPETNKLKALFMADTIKDWFTRVANEQWPDMNPTLSMGISVFPADANTVSKLQETAEHALGVAQHNGKNQIIPFEKSLDTGDHDIREKNQYLKKLQALERSIKDRSFSMLYQPIVSSKDKGIYGYEALVRPLDPDLPTTYELFHTAMSSGMLYSLGQVLRDMAFENLQRGLPIAQKMFVNLHPQEFSPELFDHLAKTFGEYAKQIVFEVTETEAIHDFTKLNRLLAPLREAGFAIALDDLGSGYSSLNTLIELRPDVVKLDLELLQHLEEDSPRSRLIHHILDYAAGEKMLVVAEGIETEQQRDIVTRMGCPLLQGFLVGRPDIPDWLLAGK